MHHSEQKKLTERIRNADEAATEALFIFLRPTVFLNVAKRLGANAADTMPLVNEILMTVIENVQTGDFEPERAKIRDYAIGVINNRLRVHFRSLKRQFVATVDELPDIRVEPDVLTKIEVEEKVASVKQAMARIPEKYSQILLMRYFEQLTIEEISHKMALPRRRVSERIHYALKLVRDELRIP